MKVTVRSVRMSSCPVACKRAISATVFSRTDGVFEDVAPAAIDLVGELKRLAVENDLSLVGQPMHDGQDGGGGGRRFQ